MALYHQETLHGGKEKSYEKLMSMLRTHTEEAQHKKNRREYTSHRDSNIPGAHAGRVGTRGGQGRGAVDVGFEPEK